MLTKIFKIISFYDKARWVSASNYNIINYYSKNLDDDTKLLTHWLCYITDRQMAFSRIWDIGGFVFSELAYNYKKSNDLELLNPNRSESFIGKNKKGGYYFKSRSGANDLLIKSYKYKDIEVVKFTPRYYPSDYFSILFTLDILSKYNFSLTKYISEQLKQHQEKEDFVQRILFSLYLLSYYDIGQPKKEDIADFSGNTKKAQRRTKKVLSILNESFESEYLEFKKNKIFLQKRAWCSLRDFFKSLEFKTYFDNSLKHEGIDTSNLFSLKSFQQFELPGDVWNNNSKFRNCILENTEYENSTKSLNKILRDYFDKHKSELSGCYPEQFDITFDFVPRMCEKNNCDICPIGSLKKKMSSEFEKTCIDNKKYYCPVVLVDCNYKLDCYGDKCELKKIMMLQ